MKRGSLVIACIALVLAYPVFSFVGHTAEQIMPGNFLGNFLFDGDINVTGNIISSEPTADNHLTTRGYVLANSGSDYTGQGGVEYLGLTSSSYDGAAVGGYKGAVAKCFAEYGDGARMMNQQDIIDLGMSAPTEDGWFQTIWSDNNDCRSWTIDSTSYYGTEDPTKPTTRNTCNVNRKIHCVRDVMKSYFEVGGEPNFCKKKSILSSGKVIESNINDAAQCSSDPVMYCNNGGCNATVNDTYMIYVATQKTPGSIGGRTGSDQFCIDQKPDAVNCADIHSFVSFSSTDEIRDIPTNYYPGFDTNAPIYWAHSSTGALTKMGNNWADILDYNIMSTQSTGTGNSNYVWTFSASSGSYALSNCGSGTDSSSSYYGVRGSYSDTDTNWIDSSDAQCNINQAIRCFCRAIE